MNQGSTEVSYIPQTAAEEVVAFTGRCAITLYVDVASAFAEVENCLIIPGAVMLLISQA